MFQMMGVFAEFERAMIRERVMSGLARAREEGTKLGRPMVGGKGVHTESNRIAIFRWNFPGSNEHETLLHRKVSSRREHCHQRRPTCRRSRGRPCRRVGAAMR